MTLSIRSFTLSAIWFLLLGWGFTYIAPETPLNEVALVLALVSLGLGLSIDKLWRKNEKVKD